MYSVTTLSLIAIAAILLGFGTGALLQSRLGSEKRKQRELERNIDQLLKKQQDYQHEVVAHFTDTAKLLATLAESYRDVHNHLANGASQLCDDHAGKILRQLPDNSLADLVAKPDPSGARAPLDYAAKASPYATGVLNEEFGLDRDSEEPEIFEDVAVPRGS